MTSPSSNNEDKDAWLLKIELKREEPEEINKGEGVSASSATPSWFWSIDDKVG